MPRVKRPEFACRVSTHLSVEEVDALEQVAREDGTTLSHVLRRLVKEFVARQARRGLRAVAAR